MRHRSAVARLLVLSSLLVLGSMVGSSPAAASAHEETRVFEMRTYIAEEGKLEALESRFRDHTIRIFEKHGMTVIGFWKPIDPEKAKNTLVYLLAFPSAEARTKAWQAFVADPEWQKVYAESQKDGRLVKEIISEMMSPTDYSPVK